MSTVYRSVFDSERKLALYKSVTRHEETNWRVWDNVRAKSVSWQSCNKRRLRGQTTRQNFCRCM